MACAAPSPRSAYLAGSLRTGATPPAGSPIIGGRLAGPQAALHARNERYLSTLSIILAAGDRASGRRWPQHGPAAGADADCEQS